MIRRPAALLSTTLLSFALSACATPAPPPVAPDSESAAEAPQAAAGAALLPKVPQPPERPVAPPEVTDPAIPRERRIAAFVEYTADTYGVDRALVREVLAQAQRRQSIIDAMNRPAEAVKQWHEYRPIFLNDARIDGGIAFYRQHREALERVAARTGVPAEVIVAIIGVETSYGRVTGNYRVLDALYTLAFDYPKRAPFFAGELAQLFALKKEEPQLDLLALKGSYAGAMGLGQFMPSSYRLWAKDGDGDGRRDLLDNLEDVFASIANYFVVHGWDRGGPVVARASRDADAEDFVADGWDPVYPLSELAARGYRPLPGEPVAEGATVLTLQGAAGPEYWLAYRNFYVITRYNRSPMYSLSVHQLSQAIRDGAGPAR
ncbi:membrane-bound lytic murein transglycosylase B [Luteimonas sp. J16]|uniref:lytic murein transglycosylase B n=1 Tax=unclassified Luteimonas TaxID=2629088 RepID=UPI00047EF5B5|nr:MULTISPECIES: lytic murein transglycosylase B [unclassified Luteimonas]TWG90713.1 membrane-bound lytic murein transglycosylase B [Luteimonas sp. J16]